MSPIDKVIQDALALPENFKVQLIKQLAESLESNSEEKAIANKDRQTFWKSQDFWQKLEKLKQQMQEEDIEINTQEIWGDARDKEVGREITLP